MTLDYQFSPYVDKKRHFASNKPDRERGTSSLPFIHQLDGLPVTLDKRDSFGPLQTSTKI